jgi:hypothetical protein
LPQAPTVFGNGIQFFILQLAMLDIASSASVKLKPAPVMILLLSSRFFQQWSRKSEFAQPPSP